MPTDCLPCNRSFRSQQALDQHMQFSTAHKRALPKSFRVHTASTSQLNSVANRTSGVPELNAVTSSSSTSQVIDYVEDSDSPDKRNRWSQIPVWQRPAMLEALLKHCHSPEDLLENKYLLRPYTAEDLAGLCECKNCGSKFRGDKSYASYSL
jgi:hypothetical protein